MIKTIKRSSTPFFDTYYVYDEEHHKYIGLLEDHCRQVKSHYYIGWYFDGTYYPESRKPGKTQMFDNMEDALFYIQTGEPPKKEGAPEK